MHAATRSRRPLYSRAEAAQQVEHLYRAFPVFDLTALIVLEAARATMVWRTTTLKFGRLHG